VPVTTLERRAPAVGSAQDILERLERYAAARRAARAVPAPRLVPASPVAPVHRFDAATIDLFPYDLIATIVGAASTILASIVFAVPVALAFAGGLALSGEWARRRRWFPSVGVNLVIGVVLGTILVLVS
jgi:hypothetical protein